MDTRQHRRGTRYEFTIGPGRPVRLHAEIRHPAPGPGRWWHTVCQTTADAQLYQAAARARDRMAADLRRLAPRNPGLVGTRWLPLPEVRAVLADAARFRRWAAAADDDDAGSGPAGGTDDPVVPGPLQPRAGQRSTAVDGLPVAQSSPPTVTTSPVSPPKSNDRPRKILDGKKPSELFTELLDTNASTELNLPN